MTISEKIGKIIVIERRVADELPFCIVNSNDEGYRKNTKGDIRMDKILLLSGTAEGQKIAECLWGSNVQVFVGKAAEYEAEIVPRAKNIKSVPELMDVSGIKHFIRKNEINHVIDATHLFATELTMQVEKACEDMRVKYQRVLWMEKEKEDNVIYVETVQKAVEYLREKSGNILIETGSKYLELYKGISDYKERCYARVSSTKEAMAEGTRLGFEGEHLIAMQGTFSQMMNEAVLRQVEAKYFVITEAGNGFMEKVVAARKAGAKLIITGRELKLQGETVKTLCEKLRKEYDIEGLKTVWLVGMGTGHADCMTGRAKDILLQADIVLGAQDMLSYAKTEQLPYYEASQPKEICEYLKSHHEYRKIVIALAGDSSFYSGAKRLRKALGEYDVEMVPGISSVAYLAANLHVEIEDAVVVSMHGKNCNVIGALKNAGKVYVLMDSGRAVHALCEELIRFGYEKIRMSVGSRLSYEDEMIMTGYPKDCMERNYKDPVIVYLEERKWLEPVVTYGFPDEEFEQGDFLLTACEARSIAISKLRLQRDAMVYDINAGYGAFSVEIARQVLTGMVYAMEKEEAGIVLLNRNRERFAAANVIPVEGSAPAVFAGLPMPTHAIISDYNENLEEILDALFQKNKYIHIVISAMNLMTVSECLSYLKKKGMDCNPDISCITVAKETGTDYLQKMTGKDPVYIIAFGGRKG